MSPQIMLYSMGGLTSWRNDRNVSPPQHIAISLAGPFAGFLFGGLVYMSGFLAPDLYADRIGQYAYDDLLRVNFWWGIFNLLPILPLDGGNVVHSLEVWARKRPTGSIALGISLLTAVAVAILAVLAGEKWIAFLMVMFAWNNGRALFQKQQTVSEEDVRPPIEDARAAIKNADSAAAVRLAKDALRYARSREEEIEAHQTLVQGFILEGDIDQAKKEADRLRGMYGAPTLLQALAGFERDQLLRAIPVLEYAYRTGPSADLNFAFANSLIAAGRFSEAANVITEQTQPEYAAGLYSMLQMDAYRAGAYEISAQAGLRAFDRTKAPSAAYNVACAEARLGLEDEALAWLDRAVDAGFRDAHSLATDPDFESVRRRPEFERVFGKLREAVA
jgi:tetratricopeptide (TPR) repeat protein